MTGCCSKGREKRLFSLKRRWEIYWSLFEQLSQTWKRRKKVYYQAMVLIQTFCWFWSIKSKKDWYTCCKSLFLLFDKSQIFILLQMIIKLRVLGHYFWTASQMGFSVTQSPVQSLNLALIQLILNLRALILVEPFIIIWHLYHLYYAIGQWCASCLFRYLFHNTTVNWVGLQF